MTRSHAKRPTRQGAPPLEIPGLTGIEPGRRATYDGSVATIRKEARREPVRRAPPPEHPVSVLVLRSYAAQRGCSTDAAASDDRRLPRPVPAGAVDHQGLLPRGLGGLPPLCRPAGGNSAHPDRGAAQRRTARELGRALLSALRLALRDRGHSQESRERPSRRQLPERQRWQSHRCLDALRVAVLLLSARPGVGPHVPAHLSVLSLQRAGMREPA